MVKFKAQTEEVVCLTRRFGLPPTAILVQLDAVPEAVPEAVPDAIPDAIDTSPDLI